MASAGDDGIGARAPGCPAAQVGQLLVAFSDASSDLRKIGTSHLSAGNDIELQIAFDESQEFQRNNPFLATMAAALGKTDAEVDAIFALAATL